MLHRCHKPFIIDKVTKNMVFRTVVAVSFMISKMGRCAFNCSARCVSAFKRVFTTILKSILVLLGVICYIPKHVVINAFFIISSVSINIFKQSEGLQDVSKCLTLLCIALNKVRSELYALCSYEVIHSWFNAGVQHTFYSLFYFLWPHDFTTESGLSSNGSTATPIQPPQSAHMSAAEVHKTDSICATAAQTQDIAGSEHVRRGLVDIEHIRSRAVTLRGSEEDLRQASERLRLRVHALRIRMATLEVNLNVKTKPKADKAIECDTIEMESPVKLEKNRDLLCTHSANYTLQSNCGDRVWSHQLTSSEEDATSDCYVTTGCCCEATQNTSCSSRYSLSEPEREVEKTDRVDSVEENSVVVTTTFLYDVY